ncbi:MAG: LysM peptidoglycan-binding domain-containing protein [Chloroflexi bacterium]|nr:LysM peptidoglycan-binding domain-containing protein [Chloroflexota bacterium]
MGIPWFLIILGLLIAIGLGSMIWRGRKGEDRWGGLSFYADLIALIVTSLLVGILALTALTSPPAPAPVSRLQQTVAPPVVPTSRPTLPPPPTATPTATDTATPAPPPTVTYTVKSGDTLSYIAQLHGVSIDAIVRANKLGSANALQIGQVLVIPLRGEEATPPAARAGKTVHVVQSGETLSEIARQYGVSIQAIQQENDLSGTSTLRVGQELIIPSLTPTALPATATPTAQRTPAPPTPTAAARGTAQPIATATQPPQPTPSRTPAGTQVYVVQGGDTLSSIAKRYGVSTTALREANPGINPYALQVGQKVTIPPTGSTSPPAPATPTAPPTATVPVSYAAPQLVAPEDGHSFGGINQEIVLQWTWNGQLGADEWFDVQLSGAAGPFEGKTWTKESHWQLPKDFFDKTLRWRVIVIRGVQGQSRTELSPPSEIRLLDWH